MASKRQSPSCEYVVQLACLGNLGGLGNCVYQMIFGCSLASSINGRLQLPSEWPFLELFDDAYFETVDEVTMFGNSNIVSDKILFGHVQFTKWLSTFPHITRILGEKPSGRGLRRTVPQLSKTSDFEIEVAPRLQLLDDKSLECAFQLWGWFQSALSDNIGIRKQEELPLTLKQLFNPTQRLREYAEQTFQMSSRLFANDQQPSIEDIRGMYNAQDKWLCVHFRKGDFDLKFSDAVEGWDKEATLLGERVGPPFDCSTGGWADARGVFGEGKVSGGQLMRLFLNEVGKECMKSCRGLMLFVQGGVEGLGLTPEDESFLSSVCMEEGVEIRASSADATAAMDWSFMRLHAEYLVSSRNSTFALSALTAKWIVEGSGCGWRPSAEGTELEKIDFCLSRPLEGGKKA